MYYTFFILSCIDGHLGCLYKYFLVYHMFSHILSHLVLTEAGIILISILQMRLYSQKD